MRALTQKRERMTWTKTHCVFDTAGSSSERDVKKYVQHVLLVVHEADIEEKRFSSQELENYKFAQNAFFRVIYDSPTLNRSV